MFDSDDVEREVLRKAFRDGLLDRNPEYHNICGCRNSSLACSSHNHTFESLSDINNHLRTFSGCDVGFLCYDSACFSRASFYLVERCF